MFLLGGCEGSLDFAGPAVVARGGRHARIEVKGCVLPTAVSYTQLKKGLSIK